MKTITLNMFTLATVRILAQCKNHTKQATGFFLRHNEEFYLVTALHVLTGRHWITKRPTDDAFLPEKYIVKFPFYKQTGKQTHVIEWLSLQLTPEIEKEAAPWLVHPKHKEDVDVAIVPLGRQPRYLLDQLIKAGKADLGTDVFSATLSMGSEYPVSVAEDVYVVGFPENIQVTGEFPIWKRGSIASEPDVLINGLPYLLIDIGTRGGMSGGLVAIRENRKNASSLFGVYSARYGAEDTTSQLGIIWKKEVLTEIFAKPTLGKHTLHTWLWL